MIAQYIYRNKKTKEIITSAKELVDSTLELIKTWRNGKIDAKKVKTK